MNVRTMKVLAWAIAIAGFLLYPLHDVASNMLASSPLGLMIYWRWWG